MALNQTSAEDASGYLLISGDGIDGAAAPVMTIQVGGKDSSGNLQTVLANSNGEVQVGDIANNSYQYKAISVSTSSVQLNVTGTNLVNRKILTIQPTNGTIYIGGDTSVTTTTGMPIYSTQTLSFAVGVNITIHAIAASTVNVRIMEAS